MLKITRILLLALLPLTILMFSCSAPVEDQLPGTWAPEDVIIEADSAKIPKQTIRATEKLERSVSFRLNEDSTMEAYTGGATITGTWTLEEATSEVFVQFEGAASPKPILLGVFTDGKLVKTHETPDLKIVTIYAKN